MLTKNLLRASLLGVLMVGMTGCMYTQDLWARANQTKTQFSRLDSQTISAPAGRSIIAHYYDGTGESSLEIPLNEQGTPLPPYDFPLQGGAGFQLAAQMRDKWYGAMTTTKPISEQPYDPGKPASNQWYMELGDNKIATAYRIKDGYQIEPVLGAAPNLGALDIIGPYSNCILIAVPLDRPRTIGARIAAQLTACLATPFTLVGDTVDFPEQVLLITVAHILRD